MVTRQECPDDPPAPKCPDGCGRPMRRPINVPRGVSRTGSWICPQCGTVLLDATIERLGAWADLEEALDEAEGELGNIDGAIQDGCRVPITAVEDATGYLARALQRARERLDTIESCLVSEGLRVE